MGKAYSLKDASENHRMRATCLSSGDVYRVKDTRVINSSFPIFVDVSICPAVIGSTYVIREEALKNAGL
ncbi:MAG: hypothetical protein KJ592_00075 [Nanoarchaeota archaeon]|nr:hypothetical protein [Nanoarchaeota archaeon]